MYDVYADQLEAYEQALAAWKARHPEAGIDSGISYAHSTGFRSRT